MKADIVDDIYHRLQSTSTSFGHLRKRMSEDQDLKPSTKFMVYQLAMLSPLLHSSMPNLHTQNMDCHSGSSRWLVGTSIVPNSS